jgi:hypothetical protein
MVMRKLIKHILKEEVSKQQIDKGIDIVINGLKKEFPFEYKGEYDAYIESQKLGEYVFEMYEYIPDELKLKERRFNNGRTYGSVRDYYKGLKVDDFIFV